MPNKTAARSLRTHQTLTLALLFLAGLVNFFDRSSLSIANTTVRGDLHLNATEMGWLLSAFSLAYGFAQLPLIGLLDRAGTRVVLGSGLLLWSLAQLLTSFVAGLPSFLALRVLLGIGEAPFYPSAIRSTREWFSEGTRARATAVMSSSQTIGLAIAPPLLTLIMVRTGWRWMFAILGLAGIAVAAAWITFHRSRGNTPFAESSTQSQDFKPILDGHGFSRAVNLSRKTAASAAEVRRAEPPATSALATLLRHRTVWGMMLGWGGVNYTVWLYLAWLPGYLQEQRHLSLTKTGWLAAIPFLAGAAGMLSSGFVADALARTGKPLIPIHRRNILAGMVVSACSTFAVAQSRSTAEAVAGISMALFFIHFAGTSGWGYVQAVSPPHLVASLGALQNFASFMIASAAPVLTGFLLDRTHSFTLALAICSAVTLLGALSYATLAGTRPLHLTPSPNL